MDYKRLQMGEQKRIALAAHDNMKSEGEAA